MSSELMCCRGCLATNGKLFDIHKNRLAEAYECITGLSVHPQDGFPQSLCAMCGVQLVKSVAFRERCRRVQACLQRQHQDKITMDYIETIDRLAHALVYSLALSGVDVYDMTVYSKLNNETSIVVKENVKEEFVSLDLEIDENSHSSIVVEETRVLNDDFGILDLEVDEQTYSSIDDQEMNDESVEVKKIGKKTIIEEVLIPAEEVQVKKRPASKRQVRNKKKVKKRIIRSPSPTQEYRPSFNVAELEKELNVDIEILNREQQLAEWQHFRSSKKKPAAFTCEECGKGFDHPTSYKNHLLRHNPSAGRFPCEVCGARFRRRAERRTHRTRHAVRLVCRDCKFVARDKSQAKLHFISHKGFTFQCKHCEKTFVKRSSYLSHVRLAHAAQNVPCGECGETFVSRLGLIQHRTKVHQAQKAASKCACASCGAPFDDSDALAAHALAGCDPGKRPCPACGASLANDEALRTHTEELHKGVFKCDECPLSFSGDEPRDTHYWRVHRAVRARSSRAAAAASAPAPARPRSRVCPRCGKQCQSHYLLEEHMRTHTGERPHACPECALRFNSRGNLMRHNKVVHLGHRPMVKCARCGKRLAAASLATHLKYVHDKLPQKPRNRKRQPT